MAEFDDHEPIPYKLSLGEGVTPLDAAWEDVSRLPYAKYLAFKDREPTDGEAAAASFISFQLVGLLPAESQVLLAHLYEANGASLRPFAERARDRLHRYGMPPEQANHLVAVFCLGILAGRKEAEYIEEYAETGIKDIQATEE